MEVEASIWIASRTRWVHLVKRVSLVAIPRVGEFIKFKNREQGDYFSFQVTEVTHREGGEIRVATELLDNVEGRGYSFEDESEFDEYLKSYEAEGWSSPHGVGPNRHVAKS